MVANLPRIEGVHKTSSRQVLCLLYHVEGFVALSNGDNFSTVSVGKLGGVSLGGEGGAISTPEEDATKDVTTVIRVNTHL